MTKFKRS